MWTKSEMVLLKVVFCHELQDLPQWLIKNNRNSF